MDAHDDRPRPRKFLRVGPVEKRGDLLPVEAGELHQLRLGERRGVQPARFALRPTRHLAGRRIERVGIPRCSRRIQREAEVAPVFVPLHAADHADRHLALRRLFARREIEQMQHARAVLVRDKRDRLAIGRKVELLHIPRQPGGQHFAPAAREVELDELHEFRARVAQHEHAFSIPRQLRALMHRLLRGLRRDQRHRARREVREMHEAFIRRDVFGEQQLRFVLAPVGDAPTSAAALQHPPVGFRIGGILHVNVRVLPRAPRGGVGELLAAARPARAAVARFAVGQQRRPPVREIVAVKLVEFPATRVLREDEKLPRFRPERPAGHRLRPEGELPPRTARRFHEMELRGVRKACADEDLAPLRMPALQGRRAEFQIAPHLGAQLRRNRRHAIRHEIVRHLRQERDTAEQEGEDGVTDFHPALLTAHARQASFPPPNRHANSPPAPFS